MSQSPSRLPADWFARIDETPDTAFYAYPRFVQHIDETAIDALTETFRREIRPGSDVLDLMSSWVSHLPPERDLPLGRVVGLGMNEDELRRNPRLTEWTLRDLNAAPADETPLPYPDATFDAVLISVSVQYLTDPVRVFRDVARVLRPGGVLIVAFSDRMFPTKATRVWQETPLEARPNLVAFLIEQARGFGSIRVETSIPPRRFLGGSDPLWVVSATRRGGEDQRPGAAGTCEGSSSSS